MARARAQFGTAEYAGSAAVPAPDPRPADVEGPDPVDTSPNGLTEFDPEDQDVVQDASCVYVDVEEVEDAD